MPQHTRQQFTTNRQIHQSGAEQSRQYQDRVRPSRPEGSGGFRAGTARRAVSTTD